LKNDNYNNGVSLSLVIIIIDYFSIKHQISFKKLM